LFDCGAGESSLLRFIGIKRMASGSSISKSSACSSRRKQQRFVVCIDNDGYRASLLVRKIYRAIDDQAARHEGMLRVIDESGEDYLYDSQRFVPVKLAPDAERAIIKAETD
jgi:hypothetical protein